MENLQRLEPAKLEPKQMKSIRHAIEVLNDAARESSSEIKKMINQDYKQLKGTLVEAGPEVRDAFREMREASRESMVHAKDKVVETGKEAASQVNKTAHQHPWYFIGASATVAGILGFFLGRKK